MDCSTSSFPVLHHLLELAQTHVHQVGDAVQPSHPVSSPVDGQGTLIFKNLFYMNNFNISFGASLIAQLVKNLPAMQDTWVQYLGREDSLEKGMATQLHCFCQEIPWTEEPGEPKSS